MTADLGNLIPGVDYPSRYGKLLAGMHTFRALGKGRVRIKDLRRLLAGPDSNLLKDEPFEVANQELAEFIRPDNFWEGVWLVLFWIRDPSQEMPVPPRPLPPDVTPDAVEKYVARLVDERLLRRTGSGVELHPASPTLSIVQDSDVPIKYLGGWWGQDKGLLDTDEVGDFRELIETKQGRPPSPVQDLLAFGLPQDLSEEEHELLQAGAALIQRVGLFMSDILSRRGERPSGAVMTVRFRSDPVRSEKFLERRLDYESTRNSHLEVLRSLRDEFDKRHDSSSAPEMVSADRWERESKGTFDDLMSGSEEDD